MLCEFQIMPPRRSRRVAQDLSEEAESQPIDQQEVPPQAPAPTVPAMEGFFQAF